MSDRYNSGGHFKTAIVLRCPQQQGHYPEISEFRSMRPLASALLGLILLFGLNAQVRPQALVASRCAALATSLTGRWPDPSTRIESAIMRLPQVYSPPPVAGRVPPTLPVTLPQHCEVFGVMRERIGALDQHYAIHFHLRLPSNWNSRLLFQGGAGSNGAVGDALGLTWNGAPLALTQGFAIVSQDSGHDNASNSDTARGGDVAFGFDGQARADYGYASLKVVVDAARAALRDYYGRAPKYAYFSGCSKGGQEGMAFAQRYPEEFDGILAAAPGFSLPRAALAEAWDVQSIAAVGGAPVTRFGLSVDFADLFSDSDLALVREAILIACDTDDGVKDGMVGDFTKCTSDRVHPVIDQMTCAGAKTTNCLSNAQVRALERIYAGPRSGSDEQLYSDWQWDTGIAAPGWRIWKLGTSDHSIPALNITLGGSSLAAVFTTPPTVLSAEFGATLAYQLMFDFAADAAKIYATNSDFAHSAWKDISARSSDLAAFRLRGGRMIVPHGVSDPVFSINDTLAWYREVDAQNYGEASRFVRVFPVPGMNHCGGGPATDRFNAFDALQDWVERGIAPKRILATAGPSSPWQNRTRALCPYPRMPHYKGHGDIESADSFDCAEAGTPRGAQTAPSTP